VGVGRRRLSSTVEKILTFDGELEQADVNNAVTVVLADVLYVGGGDILFDCADTPHISDEFKSRVVWFGDQPLRERQSYLVQIGTDQVPGIVTTLLGRVNPRVLE